MTNEMTENREMIESLFFFTHRVGLTTNIISLDFNIYRDLIVEEKKRISITNTEQLLLCAAVLRQHVRECWWSSQVFILI